MNQSVEMYFNLKMLEQVVGAATQEGQGNIVKRYEELIQEANDLINKNQE